MMIWTDEQIDAWCRSFHVYREDSTALAKARDLRQQRCPIRQELLRHLTTFLEGQDTLQEFTEALNHQAHPEWGLFGIHGLSGNTFLKKLLATLPHRGQLAHHLRSALLAPKDIQGARHEMQTFHAFLEDTIVAGQISRAHLQPDRVPSLLSTWWHIQKNEIWPHFPGDLRQHLLKELPLHDPVDGQIELYFAFRDRFLALKTAFGISAWELEHFLRWQIQQEQGKEKAMGSAHQKRGNVLELKETSRRLHLQWLLAKIGKKVGCQVWIARQDQEKSWNDDFLGQLSISSLPYSEGDTDGALLENTAVLWLCKNEVIAAYEIVPNDGKIIPALLRLYDLGLTWTKPRTRLCLVLPQQLSELVRDELARPLFRRHQEKYPCWFISEEDLMQNGEHILRWASNLEVIEEMTRSSRQNPF